MASESSSPNQVDDGVLSGESAKVVEGGGAPEAKGEITKEKDGNWPFANSEPMREDQIQNAVKFLSHPKVRGSPVMYRRSFLEKKGLTKEEIDEAFRRVPDSPSQESTAKTTVPTQERQSMPHATQQTQSPVQTLQHLAGTPATTSTVAMVQPSHFQWKHMLLTLGLLCATGAGSGVLFKNAIIPRLKSWIRRIVSEADESEQKRALGPSPVEEAVAATKAAAVAAAEVANATKEMLKTKLEDSKHLEGLMRSLEEQMKEMKSMKITIQELGKNRHELHIANGQSASQIPSETNSGKVNRVWGTDLSLQQGLSQTISKENFRGDANVSIVDQDLVRPSSAPASVEPSEAPYSKSYIELMAMVQRGEKPPGIQEINDKPPNPNQPPSNSRLQPRPKPWEPVQPQSNSNKHNTHAQYFQTANSSSVRDGVKPVGNGFSNIQAKSINPVPVRTSDNHEPWWRSKPKEPEMKTDRSGSSKSNVKISELESNDKEINIRVGAELPSSSLIHTAAEGLGSSSLHASSDRTWVPPPPPPVAMPQAAEAIWNPKSKVKNEDLDVTTEAPHSSGSIPRPHSTDDQLMPPGMVMPQAAEAIWTPKSMLKNDDLDMRTEIPDSSGSVLIPESTDDQFMPPGIMTEQEQPVSSSSEIHNITDNSKEEINHFSGFTEEDSYKTPLYKDVVKEGVEEREDAPPY